MFAHVLLLITVISCMFFFVYENLPYRSLVTDKINFAYDYIIGKYTCSSSQLFFLFFKICNCIFF